MPFFGLLLVALGLAEEWAGAAYALGLLLALWCLCVARRPANTDGQIEPTWLEDKLVPLQPYVRAWAIGLTLVGGFSISASLIASQQL